MLYTLNCSLGYFDLFLNNLLRWVTIETGELFTIKSSWLRFQELKQYPDWDPKSQMSWRGESKVERERGKPSLLSIKMGNKRSLTNKMKKLGMLMRTQPDYWMQCHVFPWDTATGTYSRLQCRSARLSDHTGGQRFEEEQLKQGWWKCIACQQQMV